MSETRPKLSPETEITSESAIHKKLLSLLSIGIWEYNFITKKLVVQASLMQMLGYDTGDLKTDKIDHIFTMIHPEDNELFEYLKSPLDENFKTNNLFEFRMLNKNNSWVWVENHCEVISFTSDNHPKSIVGYVQDITEKKDKELLSNNYRELLNKTNEVALIGTWDVNLAENIVSWSDVTKKIHGVEKNYIPKVETGINFYKEGFHREKIQELFQNCIAEKKGFDDEFLITVENGDDKWVRVIGIPDVENDECVRVYGVFQDIDEKTRAVAKLANTELKFRKTFDFAGVGMALVSMDAKWLKVNQSLCDMFGYSEEEFLDLNFYQFTHPEDIENDKLKVLEVMKGRFTDFEIEKKYIHKNGTVLWTILTVSIVHDDTGKPLHFVAQLNDISNIKRAEKKVKDLMEITKDQNDRLLNFAHIVSHNLRSHSGNLEMLLSLIKMDLPELAETEMFPMLNDAVGHLSETVHNLNEVAVLNTKTELNLVNLNLSLYVSKAISNINSLILDNSVEIINNVSDDINVSAIPAYLDSIILNFLTNSIKYKAEDVTSFVKINATVEDTFVVLSIEDNGKGIDLELYGTKLFGMYKTFHKHKDARGLGLFITKNQIEAMGGSVNVESEVNKGTTFYIKLPNEKN